MNRNDLLLPPTHPVDVVLDTDAYNEIDDQYAISYLLKNKPFLNTVALYAAPFFSNGNSSSPRDGMEKSYDEILHLLSLLGETVPVFRGSVDYLADETTPQISDAARDLARRGLNYSADRPLYVVAIGAITNVASALLLEPSLKDRIVVVWLGGHARHWPDTKEFNMKQDIAAARVVMGCGAPFVQLPCFGIVSEFRVSKAELEAWLIGKNPLADYLAAHTIETAEAYAAGKPWTRVVWDVTAVAWLLNADSRFMRCDLIPTRLPNYDFRYETDELAQTQSYVAQIFRDALMTDLFKKLTD